MSTQPSAATSGLEGISVADTRLSDVDGERGRLIIAGHDVEALAATASFEEVCALLWSAAGEPRFAQEVRDALGRSRVAAFGLLPKLEYALTRSDGMDALRGTVAQLRLVPGHDEPTAITGAVAVFAAAWSRLQTGQAPVAPDASLSHAADYLRMVQGEAAAAISVEALNAYLVAVVDHGMNASTFTARVVASTGSDRVSAVTAAMGALKGPLHGGAPGPVLDMLDAIGSADQAEAWLESELDAGRRIMGMGHRIYRVRDPRAAVLEHAFEKLEHSQPSAGRLTLARTVERTAERLLRVRHPVRPMAANVEFFTAVLLEAVGLPRALFSPTFAVSRVAGWCAHFDEQRRGGRIIRPASRYIGEQPATISSSRPTAVSIDSIEGPKEKRT